MADLTAKDVAAKLMADGFAHGGPDAPRLSDPIVDTPMVVTLEQLRPYDLNPRITRNPLYEEIKASIRERGLDAPPAITRRPHEPHFIIRNGGNTRLSILNDLWSETREERFFRIACLFRPWSARGEILSLTGHLAENELHGRLSFIERALGVEQAAALYEKETGKSLSQRELARRLSADGYPVTQSYISRMHDAVRLLLPAIPTLLYGGMGKAQIGQLIALHNATLESWIRHAPKQQESSEFTALFQEILARFDADSEAFNLRRVQDELIAQVSKTLGVDYFALTLEIDDTESRQRAVAREPEAPSISQRVLQAPVPPPAPQEKEPSPLAGERRTEANDHQPQDSAAHQDDLAAARRNIVRQANESHMPPSFREIQASAAAETVDSSGHESMRVPVTPSGPHPFQPDSDPTEREGAAPERLRAEIAQLARDIAAEANASHRIETIDGGIGFFCCIQDPAYPALFERTLIALLDALSAPFSRHDWKGSDDAPLAEVLGPLLMGTTPLSHPDLNGAPLSDAGLEKLFELIRLSRRLLASARFSATDDLRG
jgi:ParB family protein of integrating conjugative element (PFGI_1 class)